LARVLVSQERYADALPVARWSLQVREADPRTKPDTLIQGVYLLGLIHRELHHEKEATTLLTRALALLESASPPDEYRIALALDDLARVYVNLGKYVEADALYRRALGIHERINRANDIEWAETLEHFAALQRTLKHPAEAYSSERRARTIRNARAASQEKSETSAHRGALRPG
jgi:tetratricopeptide (TPR) repeat protein